MAIPYLVAIGMIAIGMVAVGMTRAEGSRVYPAVIDELIHIGLLEADHPSEPVGGNLPFVDEPVERASCDPDALCCLIGI